MTIEQIMAEMQQASRGFASGAARAESVAARLRALGRSPAMAGLCVLPSLARLHRKTHDEYLAKLGSKRIVEQRPMDQK